MARSAWTPSIWIEGLEVNARNGPEVRRKVGILFQDPDDQLFSTTVLDDVAFGPLNLGKSKAEARRIALESLARVENMEAAVDRVPHHLSLGSESGPASPGSSRAIPRSWSWMSPLRTWTRG